MAANDAATRRLIGRIAIHTQWANDGAGMRTPEEREWHAAEARHLRLILAVRRARENVRVAALEAERAEAALRDAVEADPRN